MDYMTLGFALVEDYDAYQVIVFYVDIHIGTGASRLSNSSTQRESFQGQASSLPVALKSLSLLCLPSSWSSVFFRGINYDFTSFVIYLCMCVICLM